MNQSDVSRRTFVGSMGVGAALTSLSRPVWAAKGPSDQVVMGMIGVGNQGTSRLRGFLQQPDVRIGAICDVDKRHLDRAIALVEQEKGYKPRGFGDFRRLLDIPEIDAVAVVTPDHWHAIPTVSTFEEGQDVFVGKALSYSVADGRPSASA